MNNELLAKALGVCPVTNEIGERLVVAADHAGDESWTEYGWLTSDDELKDCLGFDAHNAMTAAWVEWLIANECLPQQDYSGVHKAFGVSIRGNLGNTTHYASTLLEALAEAVIAVGGGE